MGDSQFKAREGTYRFGGTNFPPDLVNTAVLKTFLSLFASVGRSLALATRDTVLKGFPDAIEAGDG
jgi:hypothetical protein